MSKSELERALLTQIKQAGLPEPEREYRFARAVVGHGPGIRRRLKAAGLKDWRFDFAWIDKKLAVECEGGVFAFSRHVRGAGFTEDCRKYDNAVLLGWRVLRVTGAMIDSGEALGYVERGLAGG